MSTFTLPDLGEGLQEAEIVAWHVSAGDHVVADQPLLSVETEKAVVEIPSPQSGHIAEIFGAPGDIVPIGAPLVAFRNGAGPDTGTVVGEIGARRETVSAPPPKRGKAPAAERIKAAPAVREAARRLGIDLGAVTPTGAGGRITKADVDRAAGPAAPSAPPEYEPLQGVRRAMARNMARARDAIAPATVNDEADIEAWPAGTDMTIRLVQAMVAGCRAEPALNAWYDGDSQSRRLHATVDLGIAMDTADGLFVPVLRDAGGRDEADLRAGLETMKADVVQRTVPPQELKGQTITLSNFGTIGGRYGALVIVPPQVAILGAGRAAERVTAYRGKPAVRRMLPLSLTFDHRAVTGAEAARFLAAVVAELERAE